MTSFKLMLFVVVMMFVVSACGGNGSNNSDSDVPNNQDNNARTSNETERQFVQDEVELTFMMWGNQQHIDMYESLIDEFENQNPGITVKIESVPFLDYQQKVMVLAAGRELPDISWAAEAMVPQFLENGILADLSELKGVAEFDFADIFPSTLELFRQDDGIYGIPFSTPPHLLFYNKTLFEEAGLQTPTELAQKGEWTWDAFQHAAKMIAQSGDGFYGANIFRDWQYWNPLLSHTWSYGGDQFNEDVSDFIWNSEAGIETLKMVEKMMFEDESHPKAGEQIQFSSGNLGMFIDVYSYISQIRDITDFRWDIAPLPAGPEGRKTLLGEAGYVLFEQSAHPEEALELLAFLAGKEGMSTTSTFFVPPRASVLFSGDFIDQPGNPPRESIELVVMESMEDARLLASHESWQTINNVILTGFDKLFSQSAAVEDILDEMNEKIDAILSE